MCLRESLLRSSRKIAVGSVFCVEPATSGSLRHVALLIAENVQPFLELFRRLKNLLVFRGL